MRDRMGLTARFKGKSMLQMMRKAASLSPPVQMNGFHMCHHCKLLLPENLLFDCKFSSDKQALPKMSQEAAFDPNLT